MEETLVNLINDGKGKSISRRTVLRVTAGFGAAGLATILAACAPAATSPATPAPAATSQPASQPAAPTAVGAAAPTAAPTAAPAAAPGAKAKIVWFNRTNVKENKWQDDLIKTWGQKQSASEVEDIVATGDASQKKTEMVAAGQEVSIWSPAQVSTFGDEYLRGLLHDLTDVVKRDNWDWSDFNLGAYQPYEVKGKDYGMVLLANMNLFVYNRDLWQQAGVEEPPKAWGDPAWTWDECLKRLKAVTKITDDPRTTVYGTVPGGSFDNQSRTYQGADYGEAGDPWTKEWWSERISIATNWASPEVVTLLKLRQDLIKEKIQPNPETVKVLQQLGNPFLTGRVASELWGSNFFSYKDITAFKWGLAPMPHLPGKPPKSWLYVDNWVINIRTKVFDQTWEFLKYLVSQDGMKSYMLATGILVPRKSLADLWIQESAYYDKVQLKQLVSDAFANSKDSVNHHLGGYNLMSTVVTQETDALLTLKETPEVVAPRVKQRVEETAKQVKADIDKIRSG